MASLEEIRKKLQEQEGRRAGAPNKQKNSNLDNTVFPFWNMGTGDESIIRFLPDGDNTNTYFWAERQLINIPFSGVIGAGSEYENKEVVVSVPCVEMWGDQCPVHQEIRPWYKQNDPELEKLANVYWKKRTFLFQGLVRKSKLAEEAPENPIRKFWFKPQLFNLIKTIILDPEVMYSPTHYDNGLDFYLTKTKKGEWADYSTSRWARSTSPLTEEERNAIEKFGLFNLSESMPKKPSQQELTAIYEMFAASLDGAKYDPEKWGAYYRPKGLDSNQRQQESNSVSVPVSKPVVSQQPETDDEIPFTKEVVTPVVSASVESKAPEKTQSAQDILAALRNRTK